MLALALLLSLADPTPAARIARGEAAMAELDYDVAADELTLAASDSRATDDERLRASLAAGIACVIVNRGDIARVHFRYALLRNPNTELASETPQKVTSFFALIKNELAAERANAPEKPGVVAIAPIAEAPTEPTPSSTPSPTPSPTGSLVPMIVGGAGAAVVVTGLALAAVAEATLGDAALPLDDRGGWISAGRGGLVVAVLGVAVAATGGALAFVE